MPKPCVPGTRSAGNISEERAQELLLRLSNQAKQIAARTGEPADKVLRNLAAEEIRRENTLAKVKERNLLLKDRSKRYVKGFAERFQTLGEGLLAKLQGSMKRIPGARDSVDYNIQAIHGAYFGRLVAELEDRGLLRKFKSNNPDLVRDIYRETGAMAPGKIHEPVTGNRDAFEIAKIIEDLYSEVHGRENRAGAHREHAPGYIVWQTHDQAAIRALGRLGNNTMSKKESMDRWLEFVMPLLDIEKTFRGGDPEKILRRIHEELYSGLYGVVRDEANIHGLTVTGSTVDKLSRNQVLWFKDADSALKYNQTFGLKDFKESITTDLFRRSRSIGLMETFGPTPESTFNEIITELQEESLARDDAAAQLDSLRDWKLRAAFNEITGRNELPHNPGLSRFMGTLKVATQMAKMGSVVLTSLSDKAFMHSEMAFQGMRNLDVMVKNITGMAKRSGDEKRMLRLMGVAMDGLIRNALSRYSAHSAASGWAHKAQQWFFDLNLLNSWTDANKSTAAELMAAHLGEHRKATWKELPDDLRNVLSLYDITPSRWDAIRSTAHTPKGIDGVFITGDMFDTIDPKLIDAALAENGQKLTDINRIQERQRLETSIRTYFQDRVDIAIPTPGAAERKYITWNTQAGTALGEAVRMIMLFKSFPITIMTKIVGRHIYGNGAMTMRQWLMEDHRGKFNLAMMIAMVTTAGYISGAIKDLIRGRMPKPLIHDDKLNWSVINDAAIRGGSLGLLGDMLLTQYDRDYRNFLSWAGGPVVGQLDTVGAIKTLVSQGDFRGARGPAARLLMDNAPFINLFYVRPILDYFALWSLEEMLSPGTLRRRERAVKQRTGQEFIFRPSEKVSQ